VAGKVTLGVAKEEPPECLRRYLCIGYSAYDEEVLKRAAARRSSEADPVTLPYCEGLEVGCYAMQAWG